MVQENVIQNAGFYYDIFGNKRRVKHSVILEGPTRDKIAEELYRLFNTKEN